MSPGFCDVQIRQRTCKKRHPLRKLDSRGERPDAYTPTPTWKPSYEKESPRSATVAKTFFSAMKSASTINAGAAERAGWITGSEQGEHVQAAAWISVHVYRWWYWAAALHTSPFGYTNTIYQPRACAANPVEDLKNGKKLHHHAMGKLHFSVEDLVSTEPSRGNHLLLAPLERCYWESSGVS